MKSFLSNIAQKIWPAFQSLAEIDRLALMRELFGILFGLPFVIITIVWLFAATDLALLREQWPVLLLLLSLSVLAGRLSFFQISVGPDGSYSYNGSSLEIIIVFSGMFLFGPTAVWVPFLGRLIDFWIDRPDFPSRRQKASRIRNLVFNLGASILGMLLALWLYQGFGGTFPLSELTLAAVWPAFVAILVWLPWEALYNLILGKLTYYFQLVPPSQQAMWTGFVKFLLLVNTPAFFGILGAIVYSRLGAGVYLFLMAGLLLASLLARRLSQQAMLSAQRSREVSQLEQLGRAIIAAPVDASTLPQLLAEHVPKMFGYQQVEIKLFSGITYIQLPEDRPPVAQEIWAWLQANPKPHSFAPGETLPWTKESTTLPLYLSPILSVEASQPLGGIFLALERMYFEETLMDLGPALQVLADQIATALHQADVQAQTLAHQRTVQELDFAWQIQSSFLPGSLPEVAGWQLAAGLNPCKETSGDFYDVIALPNGCFTVLVADVADKGLGAALFMALSRTLIRSYALDYQTRPDLVLQAANRRILTDTRNELFVTVFYAILDPASGRLTYANAGHNPPYLFKAPGPDNSLAPAAPQALRSTGIPLGILEDASWKSESVALEHGDTLLMYTDGLTEAQNEQAEFFGEQRLLQVTQRNLSAPAPVIQESVMAAVGRFSSAAAYCDDETLVVVKRE
jgi:serine phosphatase RsbU (regulator of sigma subunit)